MVRPITALCLPHRLLSPAFACSLLCAIRIGYCTPSAGLRLRSVRAGRVGLDREPSKVASETESSASAADGPRGDGAGGDHDGLGDSAGELVRAGGAAALALRDAVAKARAYAEDAKADNTRLAYRSDWRSFATWCDAQGLAPLPAAADTVALYLAARADAGLKASSLSRALTAIVQAHLAAAHPSPRSAGVRAVLQG